MGTGPVNRTTNRAEQAMNKPFTPASTVAMVARRYMHEFGATSEDFGRVAVTMREHSATNPHAWFHGRPITLEEHHGIPDGYCPSPLVLAGLIFGRAPKLSVKEEPP